MEVAATTKAAPAADNEDPKEEVPSAPAINEERKPEEITEGQQSATLAPTTAETVNEIVSEIVFRQHNYFSHNVCLNVRLNLSPV